MIKVAITNQKGGVGKSTVSAHLAFYLAEQNHRVLAIDLDPQGNFSNTLSKAENAKDTGITSSSLFRNGLLPVMDTSAPGIYLIKADSPLADIEQQSKEAMFLFRDNLKGLKDKYDFCIIDCAPGIGIKMTAALMAAQYVLAPIELDDYSIAGIVKMLQTIIGVKQKFNPELHFLGMLPNRVKGTSPNQKNALVTLLNSYAQYMVHARIGDRQSIPESLSQGIPVWLNKKTSAREAGKEMLNALDVVLDKINKATAAKEI